MPSRKSNQQQDNEEVTRLREESNRLRRERDDARALVAQGPAASGATQRVQERYILPPSYLRSASIASLREHMGVAGEEHHIEWNRIRSGCRACMDAAFFDYSLDLKSQDGRKLFDCITAIEAQEPRFKCFVGNWGARYILQQSWTNRNAWRDASDRPDTYNGKRALKQKQAKGQQTTHAAAQRLSPGNADDDNSPPADEGASASEKTPSADSPTPTHGANDESDDDDIDSQLLVPPPAQAHSAAQKRRVLSPPSSDDEQPIAPAPKRRAVMHQNGEGGTEDERVSAHRRVGQSVEAEGVGQGGSAQDGRSAWASGDEEPSGNLQKASSRGRGGGRGRGGRGGRRGRGGRMATGAEPTRRSGRARK